MLKVDLPKDGVYEVVDHQRMGQLTLQGWHLVFMYQDVELMPCMETEPSPTQQPGYYQGPTVSVTRYKKIEKTYFLMRQDPESVLARIQSELDGAKRKLAEIEKRSSTRDEDYKALEASVRRTEDDKKNIKLVADDRFKQLQTQAESLRRMEADLAKVRKAVGELQWKEITGDPSQKT